MTLSPLTLRDRPLFIGGEWCVSEGAVIEVRDPCRNEVFARIGTASPAQVASACEAAAHAFPDWRRTTGAERGAVLEAFARGLLARRDDLIALQMLNNGKPRAEAELDLADATACFDYYAGLARNLDQPSGPESLFDGDFNGYRRAAPIGPVGLIVPWNFPLVTSAWKIAPALAAGCTAVLKVSEMTPLAELAYGDIAAEIGLPAGALNIVTGLADAGRTLGESPYLAKLSFTGSNPVGAAVMAAAAARTLPVSLELGGKSPIVVMADADVETAAGLVLDGIFMNCGQMCSATSRLIVEAPLAGRLTEALVEGARSRVLGPPETGQMGPVTTAPQYRRVLASFERARAEGARCLAGGLARDDLPGQFVAPTIYDEVATDSFLWRDELFGPILSMRRAADEAEAVALANDTEFGLAATVVSGDRDRALAIAGRVDAGHIWINAPQLIAPGSMWGGFRASGIGRELGPAGLAAYQQQKFLTAPV
ncbi:aldehyde dehydrogenase family protein [Paracoccus marinaquae]|uniref:Aldehyde dehydrogenase family protein n=1 Tax=Paracoccus marinaquae TaxID=2841926 RepID=A0ABS6AGU2_9RHOB|nr:aldehyde dehydrogenase family protein [Paracoccus marinaquae]MBU3028900.1 aldehyde dehydrogenase family protein [Paracoccus marinaquae]